jgi:catechol 2,3-dioxygenase-like lactoylglutathione lyase family enzyme
MKIRGLHHNAYRCRDAEETRKFYEDFLGLPLVNCFEITETKTGRTTHVLHLFFQMTDGSNLAFFEVPGAEGKDFVFKQQHDYDLHIALEIPHAELAPWMDKAAAAGKECRGIAEHGFIDSIYFRDPNGYVIELTGKRPGHDAAMDPAKNHARDHLAAWQRDKHKFE